MQYSTVRKAIFLLFFFSVSIMAHAQGEGPGGVIGDGGNDLVLWLRSDNGTFSDAGITVANDNDPVLQWNDLSGFGNNATMGGANPTYHIGGINGLPRLNFGDDDMDFTLNGFSSGSDARSVFIVAEYPSTPAGQQYFFSYGPNTPSQRYSLGLDASNSLLVEMQGDGLTSDNVVTPATPFMFSTTYPGGGALNTSQIFIDGVPSTFTGGATTPATNLTSGSVGALADDAGVQFGGDIYEVIAFNSELNAASRSLVENYLSAKYDIIINGDVYAGDTPGNGNYDFDVLGIGKEASGDNFIGKSSALEIIDTDFLIDNGDYILAGHDNASPAFVTTDLPIYHNYRLGRDWYIDITDVSANGGLVSLNFDLAELGLSIPIDQYDITLVTRPGATGDYTQVTFYTSITGDVVEFQDIDVSTLVDGQRYTLAFSTHNALDFDGVDDVVNIGDVIEGLSFLTFDAWVYYKETTAVYNEIFTKEFVNSWAINDADKMSFQVGNGVAWLGSEVASISSVPINTWTHLAVTWDGATVNMYINGVLDHTEAHAGPMGVNALDRGIGDDGNANENPFEGSIAELQAWSTVRTQEQIINSAYNRIISAANLETSYDFNVGIPSGINAGVTTLPDVTGNGNDGTLGGSFNLTGSTSNWIASTALDNDIFPPTILSATTGDTDLNGQIDLITVQFSEDLDVGSVTDPAGEFTIGGGYTIAGTTMNGTSAIDLALTESGGSDTDQTPLLTLNVSTIVDLSGVNNVTETITPADGAAPVLISSSPTDDEANVSLDANISLIFSEVVGQGSGAFSLFDTNDGSGTEIFNLPSASISGFGTNTLTIDPSVDLESLETYALQIGSTTVSDASGYFYSGIVDNTTLNFTSVAIPPLAPTNLIVYAISASSVTLDWTDNATDETGFLIERADDYAFTTNIQTVTTRVADVETLTFSAGANQPYFYRVTATNGFEDASSQSSVEFATTEIFPGQALTFDGVGDFVSLSDNQLPSATDSRTVELWVKTTSSGADKYFFTYGSLATNQLFAFGVSASGHLVVTQSGESVVGATLINDGSWHHAAVSYDGTTYSIYLDGSLDASGSMTTNTVLGGTVNIGGIFNGAGQIIADMDELKIWNTQKADFSDRFAPVDLSISQPNLLAYFPFDEGSGTMTVDRSANTNDGAITGAVYGESNASLVFMSVTTTTPIQNANNITASDNILIDFDASLDGSSLTDANIKVRGSQSGVISASYLGGGTSTLTIDPLDDFLPGENVTITITGGVLGLSGEISIPFNLSFSVETALFDGTFIEELAGLSGYGYGGFNQVGDYDNDGDLDLLVGGYDFEYSDVFTIIYQNTGGAFTDIGAGIMGVTQGDAEWGDYDGDGDLDLAVIGNDNITSENSKIYRNDAGTYVDIGASLMPVQYGSVSWGDYDNDGDLDLFLSGNSGQGDDVPFSDIYENNGGTFTPINSGIIALRRSASEWGDYDGDGELDLVVIGLSNPSSGSFTEEAKIYRNDGGAFIDISATLPVASTGAVSWGDYDNDNDLDLAIISATPGGAVIVRNDGGTFSDISAGLADIAEGSAAWGDYDGDGDLDLLLTGTDGVPGTYLYRNDGGSFTQISTVIEDVAFQSGASWGDMDADGDLDIIINGENNNGDLITKLYLNSLSPPTVYNATNVTTTGFTPNLGIPAGATDLIVDVSTDPNFGSFIAQGISVGTSGGVNVNTTLSTATEYYYRAKTDYGGPQSTYFVSNAFMVQPGNALSFTSNQYVDIYDDETSFSPAGDFTIEFWFNTSKTGNFVFFEKGNAETQYSVQQFDISNAIGLNVNGGTMETLGSYNDGTWHHVAIIYRGSNDGVIYVDGVDDTDTGSITLGVPSYTFGLLSIGDRRFGGSFNMEGSMDELRLWDDERTLPEITDNQLTTLSGSEQGLLAYYNFDKVTGLFLPNLSTQILFDGDLTNMDGSEWVASGRPVPPPTLTSVSIGMDPSGNVNYANIGDVIDIAFTSDEDITNVTGTMFSGGNPVTNSAPSVSGGPTNWNLRYGPTGTDTDGVFSFTIDFEDLAGNVGTQVTTVTDGSFVILDLSEPIITTTTLSGDNTTLTIDFDEDIFSDFDGLADVSLSNFTLNQSGGVAFATASGINIVSGNQIEITLTISGNPDGTESITIEPNATVYNAAGLDMVLGQSNNSVTLNDINAPILSDLATSSISNSDANISISSDEAATLYYVITQSAVQPSAIQILNGQDENGVAAFAFNSFNEGSANTYNYNVGGLAASTTYHIYWIADDATGNQSNIVTLSFTTDAPPVDLTFRTNAVSNIPLNAGTNDNLIYQIQMDVIGGTATMVGMYFYPDTTQSYAESDFVRFNFYESIGVDDFSSATLIGSNPFFSGDPQLPDSSAGIFFTNAYTEETVYWYVTADIAAGATVGNTFGLIAPTINDNFGIDEDNSKSDAGLAASNVFAIAAGDTTPPTVTLSSVSISPTSITPIVVDIVFSEDVVDFTDADITVSNGTLGTFVATDGANYTIDVIPSSDGEITLDIAAGVAQDGAGNDNTVATQFTITSDVTAPLFTSLTTASADENIAIATVIYTAAATDTNTVTYSLSGTDAAAFALDGSTGELTFVSSPDFETQASYEVVITATDDATNSVDLTLTITVNDLDEDAPSFTSLTTAIADENIAITTVIYTAAATDTNTVTYSLSGTDVAAFALDGSTGELTFVSSPDFEAQASYEVVITATDDATNSVDLTLTITVNDLDEDAPSFTSLTTASAEENIAITTVIYTAAATDTNTVTYSLSGTDVAAFALDGSTGELTFVSSPDFETQASYEVVITATDVASNSTDLTLTITVNDLDEDAPSFTSLTTAIADENIAITTVIYTAAATDTNTVTYSLSGTDAAAFALDGSTGELTFVSSPDFETQASYEVVITATDVASNSTDLTLTITVNDLDEDAPTVTLSSTEPNPTNTSPIVVNIAFSEDVVDFTVADITVSNGALANFVATDGSNYTVEVTPSADGVVTVDVAAGVAQDGAGNDNTVSNTYSVEFDGGMPSVALSTALTSPTNAAVISVDITFSESVTGLTLGEISAVNGVVSNLTGLGAVYSVDVTPTTDGNVTVDIASGVAEDVTGNTNSAAPQLTITSDRTAPVVTVDIYGTSVASPRVSGTVDDNTATLSVEIDGNNYTPTISDNTWELAAGVIAPALTDGTYEVIATATDAAGNIGVDVEEDELTISQTVVALQASKRTSNSFQANWSKGESDVVGYELDVSIDDFTTFVTGYEAKSLPSTSTLDVVTGLDFGTTYSYRVRLVNSGGAQGNSNTRTTVTTTKPETAADFNALQTIYNETGGTSWTDQKSWGVARLQDWADVTIDASTQRVTGVDLSDNNLTGSFPLTVDLTALTTLNISNNNLENLADLSQLASLSDLNVSQNSLEFDDLEPVAGIATIDYSDQASIQFNEASTEAIEVRHTSDYNLSIMIGGTSNDYQWFRNESTEALSTNTDFSVNGNNLDIVSIDFDNMGSFKTEVTSSLVPGLTINVDAQQVLAIADLTMTLSDNNGTLIGVTEIFDAALIDYIAPVSGATNFKSLDTLEVAIGVSSEFLLKDVVLGNYLCGIDPESDENFIATYFGNVFQWDNPNIGIVELRGDLTLDIVMEARPRELTEEDGEGQLDILIEEDFGDDEGRVEARRRAARRKCGLRRKTGGGRVEADADGFELIAYGETDDNGEFQFGFLPKGTYRFFVEYPGIPLDDASFVEFEVGEAGISDTDFKLEAFATEDGIEVTIDVVLGVILDYFKDLAIYPNPADKGLFIKYRHLKSRDVTAELVDLTGATRWSRELTSGYNGDIEIDVRDMEEGVYILYFYDRGSREENVVSYRVIVQH